MKKSFFYVFLLIFAVTAVVTLLGVSGIVKIDPTYLNYLFGSLLLELVATMIALFRSTKFFEESLQMNIDEYLASKDAARILMTLLYYQEKMDTTLKRRFSFHVPPGSGDFPRFLRGLSELVSLGLVDVDPGSWQCALTINGFRIARNARLKVKDFQNLMLYVLEESK
jgi:hypothetical protein